MSLSFEVQTASSHDSVAAITCPSSVQEPPSSPSSSSSLCPPPPSSCVSFTSLPSCSLPHSDSPTEGLISLDGEDCGATSGFPRFPDRIHTALKRLIDGLNRTIHAWQMQQPLLLEKQVVLFRALIEEQCALLEEGGVLAALFRGFTRVTDEDRSLLTSSPSLLFTFLLRTILYAVVNRPLFKEDIIVSSAASTPLPATSSLREDSQKTRENHPEEFIQSPFVFLRNLHPVSLWLHETTERTLLTACPPVPVLAFSSSPSSSSISLASLSCSASLHDFLVCAQASLKARRLTLEQLFCFLRETTLDTFLPSSLLNEEIPLLWRKIDVLSHALLPALRRTADCLSEATALEALKHAAASSSSSSSLLGSAFSQGTTADIPSIPSSISSTDDACVSRNGRTSGETFDVDRELRRKVSKAEGLVNLWISALHSFLTRDLHVRVPLPSDVQIQSSPSDDSSQARRQSPEKGIRLETSEGKAPAVGEETGREDDRVQAKEAKKTQGEKEEKCPKKASRYHQEALVCLAFIGISAVDYAPRLLEYMLRLVGNNCKHSTCLVPKGNTSSPQGSINSASLLLRYLRDLPDVDSNRQHSPTRGQHSTLVDCSSSIPKDTRGLFFSSGKRDDDHSEKNGSVSPREKPPSSEASKNLSLLHPGPPDLVKECFVLTRDFLLSLLEGTLATCRDTRGDEEIEEGFRESDEEEEMLNLSTDGLSSFCAFYEKARETNREQQEEENYWWGRMRRQHMERLVGDGEQGDAVKTLLKRLLQNDHEQTLSLLRICLHVIPLLDLFLHRLETLIFNSSSTEKSCSCSKGLILSDSSCARWENTTNSASGNDHTNTTDDKPSTILEEQKDDLPGVRFSESSRSSPPTGLRKEGNKGSSNSCQSEIFLGEVEQLGEEAMTCMQETVPIAFSVCILSLQLVRLCTAFSPRSFDHVLVTENEELLSLRVEEALQEEVLFAQTSSTFLSRCMQLEDLSCHLLSLLQARTKKRNRFSFLAHHSESNVFPSCCTYTWTTRLALAFRCAPVLVSVAVACTRPHIILDPLASLDFSGNSEEKRTKEKKRSSCDQGGRFTLDSLFAIMHKDAAFRKEVLAVLSSQSKFNFLLNRMPGTLSVDALRFLLTQDAPELRWPLYILQSTHEQAALMDGVSPNSHAPALFDDLLASQQREDSIPHRLFFLRLSRLVASTFHLELPNTTLRLQQQLQHLQRRWFPTSTLLDDLAVSSIAYNLQCTILKELWKPMEPVDVAKMTIASLEGKLRKGLPGGFRVGTMLIGV
ncbi:hypothetical protein CSUI_009537 [Cystoisospora suis]|uniref:Uncharacterized protein n=1 Tax=Cystoisospora suis TaxID=483139 RepID=A0A2C6KJV4_9APIC|nr:hypothetical protein CSUI_009537 [Cystoisospora suis]